MLKESLKFCNRLLGSNNARCIPPAVDWRKEGAVTSIKRQGRCACCWAFASVGAIEGIHKIRTNRLISLSAQELVDCDNGSDGCKGGSLTSAFRYVTRYGLAAEKDYPYRGKEGPWLRKNKDRAVYIDGYDTVPFANELALLKAVARQPVAAEVDSTHLAFSNYTGGIVRNARYTRRRKLRLDHAVLIVGYHEKHGIPYWIIKNSWGPSWGEKGYMRLRRHVSDARGLFGIALKAYYPIIHG